MTGFLNPAFYCQHLDRFCNDDRHQLFSKDFLPQKDVHFCSEFLSRYFFLALLMGNKAYSALYVSFPGFCMGKKLFLLSTHDSFCMFSTLHSKILNYFRPKLLFLDGQDSRIAEYDKDGPSTTVVLERTRVLEKKKIGGRTNFLSLVSSGFYISHIRFRSWRPSITNMFLSCLLSAKTVQLWTRLTYNLISKEKDYHGC